MAYLGCIAYFVLVLVVVSVSLTVETPADLCGFGDVDQTNGTIFLNIDASNSSSKLLCSRVIRITESGRLLLKFTNYRIADEDQLEILDGPPSPSSSAQNLTNQSKPFVFSASGNEVFMRFLRKNGLRVVSSYFQATFKAVPYPKKCWCRRVENGALQCEDKYRKRVCFVKCDKGYSDISLGKNISCDMQEEGKWDVDSALSCQKVSAPLMRLRVSFKLINVTCVQINLDLIEYHFERYLISVADIQKNGKCFSGQASNSCTSKRIVVTCEGDLQRTIVVNITDEVANQEDLKNGTVFNKLQKTYDALDFGQTLINVEAELSNVIINMTSLVKEPIIPLCRNQTPSFLLNKSLKIGKEVFPGVCSSCPLHHFYNPKTSQCVVCPQGISTAPEAEGALSCTSVPSPAVPTQDKCSTRCMLGKGYEKKSGFCEWCPHGKYQGSTQDLNPTCQQCPPNKDTPFSGADNISQCHPSCDAGEFFSLSNHACEKCPVDTYQNQTNIFRQCRRCGKGRHTTAEGSTTEQQCLSCSTGHFFDEQARKCTECPMHHYQGEGDQPQCKNCSDGKMTLKAGAKNKSSCIVPCQEGQLFQEKTRRCENCSKGSFQNQNSHFQTKCKSCKFHKTTRESGARNESECILACSAGEFADEKQCQKCPQGTFQDLPNQRYCKQCPFGKTTQEDGQTNLTACAYLCPAGTFLNTTRKNCSSCPFGTYQDVSDHSLQQCTPCTSKKSYVANGAVNVSLCIDMDCALLPCQHGTGCLNRKKWHNDSKELRIDFQHTVYITAVASQGMTLNSQGCFVKSYKLAFSDDGQTWTNYSHSKEGKIFVGNNNSDSMVKNYLESPILAQHIKFEPQTWNHYICMYVEVYGCLLNPTIPPDIPLTSPTAATTAMASPSSLVHATVLASKSKFGWGAYLGIVCFVLLLVGVVVAICCWRQKSKSKRLANTVEQVFLLTGGDVKKAADSPDGDELEENQV